MERLCELIKGSVCVSFLQNLLGDRGLKTNSLIPFRSLSPVIFTSYPYWSSRPLKNPWTTRNKLKIVHGLMCCKKNRKIAANCNFVNFVNMAVIGKARWGRVRDRNQHMLPPPLRSNFRLNKFFFYFELFFYTAFGILFLFLYRLPENFPMGR